MPTDRYGLRHEACEPQAVAAFERAVHGLAAHRPSTGEALAAALALDPGMTAAWALKGFAGVILGREEGAPAACEAHRAAALALARRGGSAGERALVEALEAAAEGRLLAAAGRLDGYLSEEPGSFLHAKLSQALRFMAGDARGMLRTTSQALAFARTGSPGYGFLLGCHAFGLEENGEFDRAERLGREAVALEPEDAWGIHAVSHVHEMQGRVSEGIAWIEAHRPVWRGCNNFSFHIAWHLALFHLERGDHARVLALYDAEVRPEPTDDFRDMANAVSLLWRLRLDGVAVGGRWEEVRAVAAKRRQDTTLAFACLHNLLALVAAGDLSGARELRAAMGRRADRGEAPIGEGERPDQAEVTERVGCDLADAILSLSESGASLGQAGTIARRLQTIGGSHAQRDVFLRTLAAAAAESGDMAALAQVLAVRRRFKRDDGFAARLGARLDAPAQLRRLSA